MAARRLSGGDFARGRGSLSRRENFCAALLIHRTGSGSLVLEHWLPLAPRPAAGGGGRVSNASVSYPLGFGTGYYIRARKLPIPQRRGAQIFPGRLKPICSTEDRRTGKSGTKLDDDTPTALPQKSTSRREEMKTQKPTSVWMRERSRGFFGVSLAAITHEKRRDKREAGSADA